ncbi:hypothetical protein AFK69_04480 [Xenorhabdus sp. GDc328]|nr:hypothetical protein AFK69_04480 [Xenorhabdus sp. GDc328]
MVSFILLLIITSKNVHQLEHEAEKKQHHINSYSEICYSLILMIQFYFFYGYVYFLFVNKQNST